MNQANADRTRSVWIASAAAFPAILEHFAISVNEPDHAFVWHDWIDRMGR